MKTLFAFAALTLGLGLSLAVASCGPSVDRKASPRPSPVSSDVGISGEITVARCVGYCNLPLFLAADATKDAALRIKLRYIANPGDHAAALAAPGGPMAAVTPFTNVITAYGNGQPVRIIAGSGMNGLALVARPGIQRVQDLAGKRIGTFRSDTLELLAYDAVLQAGIKGRVKFVYFSDALEPITALKQGQLDAITHVEPFVSQLVTQNHMRVLARGETLWRTDHPDCVLMSTVSGIQNNRTQLKALIKEMLTGQLRVETDIAAVATEVAQPYYQMQPNEFLVAVKAQFPQVDIRDKASLLLNKGKALVDLGYMRNSPTSDLFDFSLLEEVIRDESALYRKLKHRAASP